MVGDAFEALPQEHSERDRQQHHEPQGKPPQPGFFLRQVARGALRTRGTILFRSHKKFSRLSQPREIWEIGNLLSS
jgi:hypothetical protein